MGRLTDLLFHTELGCNGRNTLFRSAVRRVICADEMHSNTTEQIRCVCKSLLEGAKDTTAGLRHVMPTSSYIDHMNITVARLENIVGDGRPIQHFKISRCAAERDDLGDAKIGFRIAITKQAAVSLRHGD